MSHYLDLDGLALFKEKLDTLAKAYVKSINGNLPDENGAVTFEVESGGSLTEETISAASASLEPDKVYILPSTITEFAFTLGTADDGKHHEHYLILNIADTVPTITWPEGVKFAKDFSANTNSIIAVRIVNGVVLWDYLYQESTELVLCDYSASDPLCQDVSGGWTHSFYSMYGNADPTLTNEYLTLNYSATTNTNGYSTATTVNSFNLSDLYNSGYRYIKATFVETAGASATNNIYLCGSCVESGTISTALGVYYGLASDVSPAAANTPFTMALDIAGALNKSITSAHVAVKLYGKAANKPYIVKAWFSKEA